jgi:hypothetical protein
MFGFFSNITMNQEYPHTFNAMIPLGLYITSALCSEIFGKLSKEDYMKGLGVAKHYLTTPQEILHFMTHSPIGVLEYLRQGGGSKLIAPALYLASTAISIHNTERNRKYHKSLWKHIQTIDKKTDAVHSDILEIKSMIQKSYQEKKYNNL